MPSRRMSATKSEPETYYVKKILGNRPVVPADGDKQEYKVIWEGYNASEFTWEPEENLQGCVIFTNYQNKMKERLDAKELREADPEYSEFKPFDEQPTKHNKRKRRSSRSYSSRKRKRMEEQDQEEKQSEEEEEKQMEETKQVEEQKSSEVEKSAEEQKLAEVEKSAVEQHSEVDQKSAEVEKSTEVEKSAEAEKSAEVEKSVEVEKSAGEEENDLHEEPELTFVDTEESVKKTHPEALQIEEEKKKTPAVVVKESIEENKDESPKEKEAPISTSSDIPSAQSPVQEAEKNEIDGNKLLEQLRSFKAEVDEKMSNVESLKANLAEQENRLRTKGEELLTKIEAVEKEVEVENLSLEDQVALLEKERKQLLASLAYQPKSIAELSVEEQISLRNQLNTLLDERLMEL